MKWLGGVTVILQNAFVSSLNLILLFQIRVEQDDEKLPEELEMKATIEDASGEDVEDPQETVRTHTVYVRNIWRCYCSPGHKIQCDKSRASYACNRSKT